MHIRNFPQIFVKNNERRFVYYSAEARDLISLGWQKEPSKPKVVVKEEPRVEQKVGPEILPIIIEEVEKAEEIIAEELPTEEVQVQESTAFEFMTKAELLQYATDRGVDLPSNALKAELIEACKKL